MRAELGGEPRSKRKRFLNMFPGSHRGTDIEDNEKESAQVSQTDGKTYEEVSSELDSLKLQVEDLDACIENVN